MLIGEYRVNYTVCSVLLPALQDNVNLQVK